MSTTLRHGVIFCYAGPAIPSMLRVVHIVDPKELAQAKQRYIQQCCAPLDGMWLCGFVPQATHFEILDGNQCIGFYCINDSGFALQLHIEGPWQHRSREICRELLAQPTSSEGYIAGAVASTAEPQYFSLCLDGFRHFKVDTLMYQVDPDFERRPGGGTTHQAAGLVAIEAGQLARAVDFANNATGAPRDWVTGYYDNLIKRGELFGCWQGRQLIATGESRAYDELQVGYADLGMIVAPDQRKRGLATRILRDLVLKNHSKGLKSICSTEKTNVAAQKAITRAGFIAGHRIVEFRR